MPGAGAAITQLVHHGMIYVPTGYTYSPDMYRLDEARACAGRLQSCTETDKVHDCNCRMRCCSVAGTCVAHPERLGMIVM